MRRYLILLAAVLMQICMGATYSWSTFVGPLRKSLDLSQEAVQRPFMTFYIVFPIMAIFGGALLRRLGPRACATIGGVLFGLGWLLASCGNHHFGLIVTGIGVVAGVGIGFAYLVPITMGMLWFPRHKGLVTGIAVAGFGGGSALIAWVADHLMTVGGATPYEAFRLLGLSFVVVVPLAGSLMQNPPRATGDQKTQTNAADKPAVLLQPAFWLLYFAMFAGLMAGFAVNANLKHLHPTGVIEAGVAVVLWFAVGNALGRMGWGWVCDRVPNSGVIRANLLAQALVLLASSWFLGSSAGLRVFAFLIALNYGGVLVIYASTTARVWGVHRVGSIYGWLFSSNALASFAPVLAGMAYDHWRSFTVPLVSIAVCEIAAAVLIGQLPPFAPEMSDSLQQTNRVI